MKIRGAILFCRQNMFNGSNLRNMRQFYISFPNCDALRPELSWTQYRYLMKDKEGLHVISTWKINNGCV